jgi:hypothetical protein
MLKKVVKFTSTSMAKTGLRRELGSRGSMSSMTTTPSPVVLALKLFSIDGPGEFCDSKI